MEKGLREIDLYKVSLTLQFHSRTQDVWWQRSTCFCLEMHACVSSHRACIAMLAGWEGDQEGIGGSGSQYTRPGPGADAAQSAGENGQVRQRVSGMHVWAAVSMRPCAVVAQWKLTSCLASPTLFSYNFKHTWLLFL